MAEHIKNVLEREYVSKAAGAQELVPTTLGMALVDGRTWWRRRWWGESNMLVDGCQLGVSVYCSL